MYNIADYVEWDDPEDIHGQVEVLAWSKVKGYYFTQYGFVFQEGEKIIARMK